MKLLTSQRLMSCLGDLNSRRAVLEERCLWRKGGRIGASVVALACLVLSFGQSPRLYAQRGLQSYLDSVAAGQRGSAIVVNPSTGAILASWNLRRAVQDAYPPGSAAKVVEAAAALEQGAITPRDRIVCRRIPPVLGPAYRCVHPTATEGFTVGSALAHSCNYFFTMVSLRLSEQSLLHWYSVFGFGSAVDLDRKPAGAGQVRAVSGEREKALEAIGEQGVVVTAAQLLEAYSLIANRGTAWGLRTREAGKQRPGPARRITLKDSTYGEIIRGLAGCVESGTCHAAAVPGVRVAGKTGTASALDGSGATQAWFVGFAPAERPEIALVVFLDRGTGEHASAPLAGKLFRHYFAAKRKGNTGETR